MSNDLWRWADPNGQQREVRLDELRAALAGGLIAPNTPVWKDGWQGWQPAHDVPELTSASVGGANGVILNIPPPPLMMLAVQQEYEASSGSVPPPAVTSEPPPPPPYRPMQAGSPSAGQQLKTQLGGSAYVPTAPGSGPSVTGTGPNPAVPAAPGSAPGSAPRLGPSLPTAIGIPPPPELLAMRQLDGSSRPIAPPVPPKAPPPPAMGSSSMLEEVSGSMLLDSPSGSDVGGPNGATSSDGLPAPTEPIVHDGSEEQGIVEDIGLPRRPGLNLILDDIAEIRHGRPPKNKLLVGVLGVLALSVFIMLIAGIVSLFSGPSKDAKDATASASASSKTAAPPTTSVTTTSTPTTSQNAVTAPTPTADTKSSPPLGDCTTTGEAKVIAPRAVIASGIEAHPLGGGLALAFAASPRDAVATSLNPVSLSPTATVRTKPTGGDARRVTPMLVGGKLAAVPDVDRKGDRLVNRRIVAASTLIDVGFADGGIVWAPHGRDSFAKLFSVESEPAVEALRAVALSDRKGIAVAFRQGNAVHVGAAKGDSVLDADGPLSNISGLGQVGSPAITSSGDQLIVAWADRADSSDEWKIRTARIKIGTSSSEAKAFTIPEGGLGGQAMSPSVASLGGGRFLLAWTEGPVSNHQVRAITIGADGTPSGAPLAISAPGVNAGQPAAVVGPDGRGTVAFLSAKGKTLEVHATPISCPPR